MDNKKFKSILQDALEEQFPASEINLLPRIQSCLVAGKKSYLQQGKYMNKMRTKRLVLSVLTVIVVIAMLLITPRGRAWAQDVIQLFIRAEQDRYPLQPWQMTPPVQSSESPFGLSVQDAESLAEYDVLSPIEIPVGMNFIGASYDRRHHIVAQAFGHEANIELSLWQQPLEYNQACGDISNFCDNVLGQNLVGASANIETVQISGLTGEYVEGTWNLTDNGPVWESYPYIKTLRWRTNKMIFELVYMGSELNQNELIGLAGNIR
jgi:hypothetical protein